MLRVLIVEDSRTFASLLAKRVHKELGFEPVVAQTLAEAKAALAENPDFLAALLDINLPDAPRGEVVDVVIEHGVPSIVFTGEMCDALREEFWSKRIVDYVLKESLDNVDYVLALVKRLEKNPDTKILVVDDSATYRRMVANLLEAHCYQVLEAANGRAALRVLMDHPDVKLVTVDYNMPDMDGATLTREIRRKFGKDVLAIVGISGEGHVGLSARFIKSGANDYLNKPFLTEEFYTRISQNLDMLDRIFQIRDMAERDFLTRTYNRRYFFSAGARSFANLTRRNQPITLAMLDIDHFKKVNDTYGHEAGDAVLRQMSALLASRFRNQDIVSRLGGEEFCVLAADMTQETARLVFEDLRRTFQATPAYFGDQDIPFTVSIGLCCRTQASLEQMVKIADDMLYRSKTEGRNRVTMYEGD